MTTLEPIRDGLLRATAADLPPDLVRAMEAAAPDLSGARRRTVRSGRIPWASAEWGDPSATPLVLIHGVTSNAETFWRVAPALAAAGRHVVAVDMPGHGRTGSWQGRHRFTETAADLAAWLRTADLDRPGLAVLGHSWGGLVVAALPAVGLVPDRLILLDPPALPLSAMEAMTHDPLERPYATVTEASAAIRSANPGWLEGDIEAKALGLTQFDLEAVVAILIDNGDWDGGLGALADPAAGRVPVWLIRGEFARGGLIPEAIVPAFASRVGADHVITIADAPHSPQRLYPEATILAILRALGLAWP
ncbi:MAG: alpha/beta fold hydrolase [Chloroflexi bacterium]|nr:alpha/beta fold hydrolase [Chloroflexota bacterium]